MRAVSIYLASVLFFLAADFVALKFLLRPLFERHLGEILAAEVRLVPAAVFYLFYIGCLVWFVSLPALAAGAPKQALLNGALLGLMCYGTYEFTNYATLAPWHGSMVWVDCLWGAVLTGTTAWFGVFVVDKFALAA